MSSHTWACFGCRERFRRSARGLAVRCPTCGLFCEHLGTKIEAPPKTKVREWATLQEWYFTRKRAILLARQEQLVRRKHWLEREIEKHQSLTEDKQRRAYIRKLESELADITV
jgi:uncharacterized Zn finger protein (UPF0148 family)